MKAESKPKVMPTEVMVNYIQNKEKPEIMEPNSEKRKRMRKKMTIS